MSACSGRAVVLLACSAVGSIASGDVNIQGTLSHFDAYNDTGRPAHGFEIELSGASSADLYYLGFGQRYGTASSVPYTDGAAGGVIVRWSSPWSSAGGFTKTTPVRDPNSTSFSWQDCYLGGGGYASSGCESLTQGLRAPLNPNMVAHGYWLLEDAANPGTLVRASTPVAIPITVAYSAPPVAVPAVVVEIEAPEPPEAPELYGDAQWVKIYKAESTRAISPEELASGSVVPRDPAQLEVDWDLLQADPPSGGNQNRKGRKSLQDSISPSTAAIIRRVETYKYLGAYDAVTHAAVCADGTCSAPSTGELGDFIGAHDTAVNVNPDAVLVTVSGNGSVADASGAIKCGRSCESLNQQGGSVTLTANPGNSAFAGWSGACSGTQLSCTVTVNGQTRVGASFKPQYSLSVGKSNSGTVTSTPGNDRTINCGGTCSAKFTEGAAVTLTATPFAGKQFIGWTKGPCTGSAPVCMITVNDSTSVQASFSK